MGNHEDCPVVNEATSYALTFCSRNVQRWVVEQSEPDFRFIRELDEEKCLVGLHVSSPHHGGAYVHLRLSRKGREMYQRLRAAFPST